ncbi:MAG: molybdenum cofactor biosynthesis protein MoaE [Lentimicrobium sp.]|jgi:molybdopterin synthase catalytic subunit|nr:molybdenum cofactor biosynthesis protein MoaE [Lentimicrobium sp.]
MKEKKKHNVFVNGPITPEFIANSIAKHSSKTDIGAHDIFLGQVRSDLIDNKTVVAIKYEAYQDMADELFHEIREASFAKYNLVCMHIYHSLGVVKAGEIGLFVFVSSKHRKVAFEACQDIVEQIKAMTPIWGKEIFEDDSFVWKENQ